MILELSKPVITICSLLFFLVVEKSGGAITHLFGFGKIYNSLSHRYQKQWDARIVSQAHCIIILPLSLHSVLTFNGDIYDIFAPHSDAELPIAITLGYFLADLVWAIQDPQLWGIGMFVHAVSCVFAYSFALIYRFLLYYGPIFLLWETSTIFLNIRGFLLAMGKESSSLYLVNGIILILTFFSVRICYGYYQSYLVWKALLANTSAPLFLIRYYQLSNIVMNSLNTYWMSLMFRAALSVGKPKKKLKKIQIMSRRKFGVPKKEKMQ